ncbi:hypothetical protein LCGC14_1396470 [marine sediment metagenome]|uniref:PseI/NeuA/B-like domain-containing protein n=1 Tax=marine sediment metagenome TaxID=412755 RepID=A0A0F9KJE4_9ZZZZ
MGASVFDEDAIDLCCRLGTDFIKLATREQSNQALRESTQQFKGTIFRSVDFAKLDHYEPRMPREVTLACIPRYPTTMTSSLLDDMTQKLRGQHLPAPWGWSSHSVLFDDVVHATSLGARVIEKHLRLYKSDIEARWSINPGQWSVMERILKCL